MTLFLVLVTIFLTSPVRAEEKRPAPDAELLMARYWTGGMVAVAGVPDAPSQAMDFALYSDGTILLSAGSEDLGALPGFKVATLSPEIAKQRHAGFLAAFSGMERTYDKNCWIPQPDGSRRGMSCVSDAYTANVVLKDASGKYLTVSVDAAGYWKELPDILDFVPAKYFELMVWMNALEKLPSAPWIARNFAGYMAEDAGQETASLRDARSIQSSGGGSSAGNSRALAHRSWGRATLRKVV